MDPESSSTPSATAPLVSEPLLLSQIVGVSNDAIFSEDVQGRVTSWNPAAERIYGCAAVDVVGSVIARHLPEATASQLESVRQVALQGRRVERLDAWHERSDGRRIAVSLSVSPLRDGEAEVAGSATTVQDVTEQLELTAEFDKLQEALAQQNRALVRSNRDLEQFAYVASHDLSEPLRAMTGFVQLLERRYATVLDERGLRYIEHVVTGASRMRALIEDLLEYSRYVQIDAPTVRVDVAAVARKVAATLGSPGVSISEIPDVWFDPGSVEAIVQNLISNALKFRRPGVEPLVEVTGRLEGSRVLVCVDDNGIGIEPEYRERIFRMFARLHDREAYSGTGIGLAIVRQVAEQSGGEVWVEESPLGGSRFCVTLPATASRRRP